MTLFPRPYTRLKNKLFPFRSLAVPLSYIAKRQSDMSYSTTQSAEVGAFIVRFALCPVLAALGILLKLVYPSGQGGNSHPGNGTTLVTLPTFLAANRTHPGVNHSTVAIQYLPTNLHDPGAVLLVSIASIAVGVGYIIHLAQRVDETRKIESRSREEYYDRSWNSSFSQEMQEVCRNAGKGDRVVAFLIFSTAGLCCLAAWTYRIMDKVFGQAVPPSAERLDELRKMADGDLVLGAQALPWNYTREAWVCGWKGMVLDPKAASRFSTPCTRIVSTRSHLAAFPLIRSST